MSIDRNHIDDRVDDRVEMNAVPAWRASAHGPVSTGAAGMRLGMSIAIEKLLASDRTRCAFKGFQVAGLARDGRHERRGAWRGRV